MLNEAHKSARKTLRKKESGRKIRSELGLEQGRRLGSLGRSTASGRVRQGHNDGEVGLQKTRLCRSRVQRVWQGM